MRCCGGYCLFVVAASVIEKETAAHSKLRSKRTPDLDTAVTDADVPVFFSHLHICGIANPVP